ncbi:hypothetical protein CDAR_548181 [Caerostris darwini]|uniref:Uncharacterized protein n=1 Tax=Caerostris darwini TaxID=1538125 RepID=A0AAV4WEG3_9ARAC|nr:hypothetical protein CDAR_548181 [Caerostris darwini]
MEDYSWPRARRKARGKKIKATTKKNVDETQTQLSFESESQLWHLNHFEMIQDLPDSPMRLPGDGYNGSGRRIDEDAAGGDGIFLAQSPKEGAKN